MKNDNKMLQRREKEPKEFGSKKFYVEIFSTTRYVICVYADNKKDAITKTTKVITHSDTGNINGFVLKGGVSDAQWKNSFNEYIGITDNNPCMHFRDDVTKHIAPNNEVVLSCKCGALKLSKYTDWVEYKKTRKLGVE